jgi:dTDP-4-amino-4,6-dideoxygalactose transaminase
MAFLSVDRLENVVARNYERYEAYQQGLSCVNGLKLVPYAEGERVNYQMAVVEIGQDWALTSDQTVRLLRAEGAEISAYYSPPLHKSEHCPAGLKVANLTVAEELAEKFIQLPVGELMSVEDTRRICQLLSVIGEYAPMIAERLNGDVV